MNSQNLSLDDIKKALRNDPAFVNQAIQPFDITPNYTTQHTHNGVDCPTVDALNFKNLEQIANKVITITGTSDTNYPSEKAVSTYVLANGGTPYIASDDVLYTNNTQYQHSSGTAYKLIQIQVPYSGVLRFKTSCIYGGTGSYGHLQVYVNGVAKSGVYNCTNTPPVTTSDDLTLNKGDLIQCYVWSDVSTNPTYINYGASTTVCGKIDDTFTFTNY